METHIERVHPVQPMPVAATAGGIENILRIAIEKDVDVGTLERLVALSERISERQAASEFNGALAAFQAECPSIEKTSKASITTKSGGQYEYRYAELDEIAKTTRPILQKYGLSYTWDSEMAGDKIIVTCTVRHIGGHSQTAKFTTPTESLSTGMSAQQKHASALTYARRQSLIQALGLTTTDADADAVSTEKISADDVAEIEAALAATGSDLTKFLQYMRIGHIEEMPKRDLLKARAALKRKASS